MIVITCAILGGIYGGWIARKRGGKPADIAQYAAAFAIAFALAGLFATVFLNRMA